MRPLVIALALVGCMPAPGDTDAAPVAFAAVSTGGRHTCALSTSGAVACWGHDDDGQADPPAGTFAAVSAGGNHSCALDAAGAVTCWGDDEYGQSTPP